LEENDMSVRHPNPRRAAFGACLLGALLMGLAAQPRAVTLAGASRDVQAAAPRSADLRSAAPLQSTATAIPTSLPPVETPVPTAIPTAVPPAATPIVGVCVCDSVHRHVPAAVLNAVLANPGKTYGWQQPLNPNKPPNRMNPVRECLGLRNPSVPYNPYSNGPIWKVGCP
jgi:hypothetical protein